MKLFVFLNFYFVAIFYIIFSQHKRSSVQRLTMVGNQPVLQENNVSLEEDGLGGLYSGVAASASSIKMKRHKGKWESDDICDVCKDV